MHRAFFIVAGVLVLSFAASAQTADEIVAKYIQQIGGAAKLKEIKTLRFTGKFVGGGGFEADVVNEKKRPNMVRDDFMIQGFTVVSAYDGTIGWKINPFQGKKDAESLGEEELKQVVEEADFDGPLVDHAAKGNKVEYVGKEDYEGSDVYKLKVTLTNGTEKMIFLDTEYYIPLKVETKQINRGTESETETILGDYKLAGGIYFAFSIETGPKGSANHASIVFSKIEVNPTLDDSRFAMPGKK